MADNKLDTGSSGFDVDGQMYTYDTGLPEADGGPQGPYQKKVDVSPGFQDPTGKPKDLTKKTKTTLAQYLSDTTRGKNGGSGIPNRYPVDPGLNEISITDKTGAPASIAGTTNSAHFADQTDINPYSQQYPIIRPSLKKGKEINADANSRDGNDLLREKQASDGKQPDMTPLGKYQSSVLSRNRFSDAATAFAAGADGSSVGFNPQLTRQSKLGSYDPLAPTVTLGRLAVIGPLLAMRAGKELDAASAGANPNDGGMQAKALLPGFGQLGVTRIDPKVLEAADVLASLTTDELDSAFVVSPAGSSWGQLNNPDDPYSGTDAFGMMVLSTALVAGVELLFDALSVLFGLITPTLKTPARDSHGRYTLGEYLPGSRTAKGQNPSGIGGTISALTSLNFGALIGIQPTNYPFSRALTTGMNAFFQVPDKSGGGIGLNQLAGAASSSVDSPGFNVVVARAIIRSSVTIIDQLKKIGGNVINAVSQVMALIDVIRSSKLIAACNVWATLGDAILSNPDDFNDKESPRVKVSRIDAIEDSLYAQSKNRLKGTLKLAWAQNRAPSNILLPPNIFAASLQSKNMGQFSTDMGMRKDPYSRIASVVDKSLAGRLPIETVFALENELEASYVPFYFHDVRTNEVVSFHAFIASLTDEYTANYDNIDGFGRVESVKIYRGTNRRISLSFYVVATSFQDFNEMWIKINKLVTLVYPQYTKGIQVQNDPDNPTYVFTQPFSQLIGASPLIRLRLGDLLRSNYSIFALGRLFGMGDPNFKIDGQKLTAAEKIDQSTIDAYEQTLKALLTNPDGSSTFFPDMGQKYQYVDVGSAPGGPSIPSPPLTLGNSNKGPKFAAEFDPSKSHIPGAFIVKVLKVDPDSPYHVIGEVAINDDPDWLKANKNKKREIEKAWKDDSKATEKVVGGTFRFPITALTPTKKTALKISANASALSNLTPDSDFGKKLGEFLKPESNAIVKSFRDTGGKGLAGFIESMSFDWYDRVTWETDVGNRAPKMCKVTIGFHPIHDISPGIDHNGFNRAPVYPVGAMSQGSMPYDK